MRLPLPTTIVTGALGVGKTTVIASILARRPPGRQKKIPGQVVVWVRVYVLFKKHAYRHQQRLTFSLAAPPLPNIRPQ
jgi:hypothetical protein